MKYIIQPVVAILISILLIGCSDSTEAADSDEIKSDTIKNDLVGILNAIKSNDYENFYIYFPNEKILDELYVNSKYDSRNAFDNRFSNHLQGDRNEFFKLLKGKFEGSSQDWMNVKPTIAYVQPKQVITGIEKQLVGLIFQSNNICYGIELFMVEHKGDRCFFVKEPIDRTQYDCNKTVESLKEEIKEEELIEF